MLILSALADVAHADSVNLVTGNGYSPFADESLPGGGWSASMVSTHEKVGETEVLRRNIMAGIASGDIPQPKKGMASFIKDAVWVRL
jgi:hypothetical protein